MLLIAELSRRGYTEGVNIVFEVPLPQGPLPGELDQVAKELVKARVDLILASGGQGAIAAKKATSTIPIVFGGVGDAATLGIVQSLSRPGANLTGSSLQASDTDAKELQLFVEASGKLTNVVCLTKGFSVAREDEERFTSAANALGIRRFQFLRYESVRALEPVVERLAREGIDGVVVSDPPRPSEEYRRLAALLIKLRLPSIGNAEDGFLLGYKYATLEAARVVAKQVDQILKGAKPGEIPVEQITTFELEINLRTAKALGLSIPSSVLLQATRLIE